jgi:hypothetical protein
MKEIQTEEIQYGCQVCPNNPNAAGQHGGIAEMVSGIGLNYPKLVLPNSCSANNTDECKFLKKREG